MELLILALFVLVSSCALAVAGYRHFRAVRHAVTEIERSTERKQHAHR